MSVEQSMEDPSVLVSRTVRAHREMHKIDPTQNARIHQVEEAVGGIERSAIEDLLLLPRMWAWVPTQNSHSRRD